MKIVLKLVSHILTFKSFLFQDIMDGANLCNKCSKWSEILGLFSVLLKYSCKINTTPLYTCTLLNGIQCFTFQVDMSPNHSPLYIFALV